MDEKKLNQDEIDALFRSALFGAAGDGRVDPSSAN
jgi:hypothetical protein